MHKFKKVHKKLNFVAVVRAAVNVHRKAKEKDQKKIMQGIKKSKNLKNVSKFIGNIKSSLQRRINIKERELLIKKICSYFENIIKAHKPQNKFSNSKNNWQYELERDISK